METLGTRQELYNFRTLLINNINISLGALVSKRSWLHPETLKKNTYNNTVSLYSQLCTRLKLDRVFLKIEFEKLMDRRTSSISIRMLPLFHDFESTELSKDTFEIFLLLKYIFCIHNNSLLESSKHDLHH